MIDANGREWSVLAQCFDYGHSWGVAIESRDPEGRQAIRRNAVRVRGVDSEDEAVAKATPELLEWANREPWDIRKGNYILDSRNALG